MCLPFSLFFPLPLAQVSTSSSNGRTPRFGFCNLGGRAWPRNNKIQDTRILDQSLTCEHKPLFFFFNNWAQFFFAVASSYWYVSFIFLHFSLTLAFSVSCCFLPFPFSSHRSQSHHYSMRQYSKHSSLPEKSSPNDLFLSVVSSSIYIIFLLCWSLCPKEGETLEAA